jgi:alginate O-acetyltransferase complex protein AlgI
MVTWKLFPTRFIIRFNLFFDARVGDVSPWLGAIDRTRNIILPIGLSFATFRAIDLLVKVYLEVTRPLSVTRVWAVGFFPPVQVIGPVMEHTEIEARLDTTHRASPDDVLAGVLQIAIGLVKIFVLSYALKPSIQILVSYEITAWWKLWVELFAFAWYFFFNFAGFSDLAIGSARPFGFRLKPNFNNPYLKTNPQDFWNSWHMSLTRFAQRNVFIPLGGMRPQHQYRAIFATIMVIALWHDLSIPLVIFGLYHSAALIGHRFLVTRRPPAPAPSLWLRWSKSGALFTMVAISLPLLTLSLANVPDFYGRLLGIG